MFAHAELMGVGDVEVGQLKAKQWIAIP